MENRLPKPLDCTNLAKEWPTWRNAFQMYMFANGKQNDGQQQQIATFLWLIGPSGVDIYNTIFLNDGTLNTIFGVPAAEAPQNENAEENDNDDGEIVAAEPALGQQQQQQKQQQQVFPAANERTLALVLRAFDSHCTPKKNMTMESFKFNTIMQKEKQPFAEFETELRKQMQYCGFDCNCGQTYVKRMLRDRIIIGVYDKKLQLRLLDGRNDSLEQVIDMCKTFEAANANKLLLDRGTKATIDAITQQQQQQQHHQQQQQQRRLQQVAAVSVDAIVRSCYNCGYKPYAPAHLRYCKANNAVCMGCNKKGHFQQFRKNGGKMGQQQLQ